MNRPFWFPAPKPEKRPKSSGRSRLKSKNYKRLKKLRDEQFGGAYRDYIVSLPCDICGVHGYSEPAHLDSRGSGGKADVLAPLCGIRVAGWMIEGCHQLYDTKRWTLPEGTEERLKKLAAERWDAWLQHTTGDTK